MPSSTPIKKSARKARMEMIDTNTPQETIEELRGLTLCLQHLSEQAQQHECFSAESYILLAAEEVNKTIIKMKKKTLTDSLCCNELILNKLSAEKTVV